MNLEHIKKLFEKSKKRTTKKTKFNSNHYTFVHDSLNLLFGISESKRKILPVEKQIAYHNFLVNLVTSVECFLKNLILSGNFWNEDSYKTLLKDKEKIDLFQAFELFGNVKVTRQLLITHYYSFQNFNEINKVFTCLIQGNKEEKTDFVFNLGKTHFETFSFNKDNFAMEKIATLNEQHPEWKRQLIKMFEIRNEFIHERTLTRLTLSKVIEYWGMVIDFENCVDAFFAEQIMGQMIAEKRRKKKRTIPVVKM